MAEKVTISLEVDVSDLEELSKEGKEAGDEMESAFSKISKQAKNLFDQGAFDKISGQLLDLNEGFNNLLRESIEPLTRQMGVFGTVIDFALERFIDFKDALVTGPIKAFSGSIAFATGTIKSLAQAVPVVGDSIKGLINQIPKLTSVFLALSTTVQGAIAGQLAVLPGILGAIGIAATGLATTLGRSLEDSFNRVAEIVAGTTVRMKELEQQLIRIGSTVPENLDQVAKTMRTITKAGIRSEKTIDDLTRTTVKLGRLADASFTQVGEQITNIATSFDLLGQNAGENVDAFANDIITVRNNTVAGVSEITTSLRRVASSASVLDIPIDQMLALTGAIQQAGQTARRSGTRLRRGFEEIVQTLSDVEGQRAFADLLEIDTSKFRKRIKEDVGSVILDLANALGNSEENAEDFANTIDTLGTAGGTALTAVASKAGLLNELISKMSDNTNALQKATETTLDRFSQQFSILTDKITLFFKTVGLAILDPFTNLVRNINEELDQARSRVMAFARTIRENIPDIKDQISELFGFEGEGFTGFNLDALKEQVNTTFKEVGNLFGDTIITILKAGIKNVILPLAITFGKNSIAVFKGFFSTDFAKLIWNNLKWAFNNLIGLINNEVLPLFGRMASLLVDQIKSGLSSLAFTVGGKSIAGIDVTSSIDTARKRFEELETSLTDVFKVVEKRPELEPTVNSLNNSIQKISDSWGLLSDEQKETAKSLQSDIVDVLKAMDKRGKDISTGFLETQFEDINKRLSELLQPKTVKDNIEESKNALNKMSEGVSDNMVDTLFNLIDEGIFTEDQKQRIKNNSKEIASLIFGEDTVKELKKSLQTTGDGFPVEGIVPDTENFNRFNNNLDRMSKKLSNINKNSQNFIMEFLSSLFEGGEFEPKELTRDMRIDQLSKQWFNSVQSAWANGIEALIKGEDFDVVEAIGNSLIKGFSENLASELTRRLGTGKATKQLAQFTVNSTKKILDNTIGEGIQQAWKNFDVQPLWNFIKNSTNQILSFVNQGIKLLFSGIKNIVKSQQFQNILSTVGGGIGSLFGFRKGGQIPQMAEGGSVKGQGGIDEIMAMLSRGEFVVRREAVNAQTLPFLQQLNNNKGFRQGGQVGSNSGQSDGLPNSGNKYEININAVDASSFQALVENNPEVITRQIEKNIEKNGSVRKMIQQKASK